MDNSNAKIGVNKKLEEKMKRPDRAVDGQTDAYSASDGFAQYRWPETFTSDFK